MSDLFIPPRHIPRNESIAKLIKDFEEQFRPVFSRVKRDWNDTIRAFLRDTCGLKLVGHKRWKGSRGDIGVEIRILPDSEGAFIKLIDERFPDLDFDEFVYLRNLQEIAEAAGPFKRKESFPVEEVDAVLQYTHDYFAKYDLEKIIDELFKKRGNATDIWGMYWYAGHHIDLYYLPLIVFAKLKKIDLESAIVKVLAHELGHAYHHCGKDQDEKTWLDMPFADTEIKEGLAQYYTRAFVEDQALMHPSLKEAYDAMVAVQSGPYRIHEQWDSYSAEAIRLAMFRTRRNSIRSYDEFIQILKDSQEHLGGKPTSPPTSRSMQHRRRITRP
jgi:hypothetical protein